MGLRLACIRVLQPAMAHHLRPAQAAAFGALVLWLAAAACILAAGLVVGARRAYHFLVVRPRLQKRVVHYELVPVGERPDDEARLAVIAFEHLNATLAAQRLARFAIHRYNDGNAVHVVVSLAATRDDAGVVRDLARTLRAEPRQLESWPAEMAMLPYYAYATRLAFTTPAAQLTDGPGVTALDLRAYARTQAERLTATDRPAVVSLAGRPMSTRELTRARLFLDRVLAQTKAMLGYSGHAWYRCSTMARCMLVAGGWDPDVVRSLVNVGSLLPAYDSTLKQHLVRDVDPLWYYAAGAVAWAAAAGGLGHLAGWPAAEWLGAAVAGAAVAALVVAGTERLRLAHRAMVAWMGRGVPPVPPRTLVSWFGGLRGGTQRVGTEGAGMAIDLTKPAPAQRRLWHPYRTVRRIMVVTPAQLATLCALPDTHDPTAQASATRPLPAPKAVREATGCRLGYDADGYGCQVPDGSRTSGIAVLGAPGQGKTTALLSVFASDLLARRDELVAGERRRAVVWVETKGEGAGRAVAAARAVGYEPGRHLLVVNVADPAGVQLVMFDRRRPAEAATMLAEAMRYAFDANDIRAASADILRIAFELALRIPPDVLRQAGEDPAQGVVSLAHKLLGGDPATQAAERIVATISAAVGLDGGDQSWAAMAAGTGGGADSPLGLALRAYLAHKRSRKADEEAAFAAPRNKLSALAVATSLWHTDPSRPAISLHRLLAERRAVVLNFAGFTDEVRARLGAITFYCLWEAIKEVCDDWGARGWSLSLLADELSDVAGTGNDAMVDVVDRMYDQGRSRGVWLSLATQRTAKLRPATRNVLRSFGSKVYLRQGLDEEAAAAAADLSDGQDGVFSLGDIRRLQPMTGLARFQVGDELPPPFVVHIASDDEITEAGLRSAVRRVAAQQAS